ncbi:macro domain-containing protein [Tannerella forsythia]|uniref:macro domain-containing protein n=1 Tax=Tannerella forsythia TaxID=28112 RepID=UPI0027D1F0DC|nr:macro domain-containing protein [Tannerella forsythia]
MECHRLMQEQGSEELTNSAKMTKGYNLPARYVIHTVGPIIQAPRPPPLCRNRSWQTAIALV